MYRRINLQKKYTQKKKEKKTKKEKENKKKTLIHRHNKKIQI